MNDPILVRRKVRTVLSAMPVNRPWASEELILTTLNDRHRFFAEDVTVQELRTGLEWNHGKGYIEFRVTEDDVTEWFLTESGRHKEGLS